MRKYIYITLIAAASIFCACKDTEKGEVGPVNNLKAEPNIGAVVLTWDNPSIADYYYSVLTYINSEGEEVKQKVSVYSEDSDKGPGYSKVKITGFEDTNTYDFTLTPYTADGYPGEPQSVSCAPEDVKMAYKYIASSAVLTPLVEGAKVKWVNEWNENVDITIKYKNVLGESKTLTIPSSKTDSTEIAGIIDPTSVTVTSAVASNVSEPTVKEVTPLTGEIPHSRFKEAGASSVWAAGFEPSKTWDDNVDTYWHTALGVNYPHWINIDLGDPHQVKILEVVRRKDKDNEGTPLQIGVEYSNDGTNFTEVGKFDFEQEHIYNHAFSFSPVVARYWRVVLYNASFQAYAYFAEVCLYNGETATHYAEESAKELMPDPDDDATVYPNIEYLYPYRENPGWLNHITAEQENPDNVTEWTYKTTGGDSWLFMTALKANAAGPMLIFQYKSTADLNCEFFWMNNQASPAGGRETSFSIKKTEKWVTFKKNFAADWAAHSWDGGAGKSVRFDIGDGGGETVVIRNMHWRALEPGE